MKRKLLSLCMVLALCLTMLPVAASAAGPDPSITNIPGGMTIEGTVVTDYEGTATVVDIPEGVTEIDDRAFLRSTVQEVTLPSTLTTIGEYAFASSALTSITIPESVTTIEAYAFTKTKSLIHGTILGNPTLGNNVFSESGIKSIEMDQVTAISYQCFASSSLSSISMDRVESIGQGAFQYTNFTEFTVPDTAESIGPYFLDYVDLDKLTISLATLQKTGIHENAFANISSPYEVVLTDVDTDITLLEDGFSVGNATYTFLRFSITTVQEPSDCTITNQTGGDVSIVVGGETITVPNGNVKSVGIAVNSDAYLENLTVTADSSVLILDPSFANLTTEYTSNVGNDTASVAVMAQPSNSAAAVAINGQTADASNSYTVDVELAVGENPITIVVTAPGGTPKTYTVTVTRNEAVPKHLTISTAAELMDFAAKINNGAYSAEDTMDMVVELTADIDMSGYDWVPIVASTSDAEDFCGTFDGNDHSISNLYIDNKVENGSWLGLFGGITGDIRDIHVTGEFFDLSSGTYGYYFGPVVGFTNGDVTGCTTDFTVYGEDGKLRGYPVGGVVGYIYGPDETPLKLEKCVSYTDINSTLAGQTFMGGIAGASANTEIINCRNEGTISISGVSGYYTYIGGIVGQTQTGTVVDHCVNNGDITQAGTGGTVSIGGICGRVSTASQFTCCTNNGNLDTQAGSVGGIVGATYYGESGTVITITQCLNNGAVSSKYSNANVAGLIAAIGSDSHVEVTASISLGQLSADSTSAIIHPVAANVSASSTFTISNNYYDNELTIQDTNKKIPAAVTEGSTGKPLTELETETFIQQVNSEGGNFRLDEDGHIEVIPLSYTLTVVGSYADVSGAGAHEEGEQVIIDAGSRPGYRFTGWTATASTIADPTAARTTFIMPDEAATVTATWVEIPDDPDPSYSIQMDIGDHGSVHTSHRSAEAEETVTLTVTPDDGYVLESLTVIDSRGNAVELTRKSSSQYTFEMPARTVTATAVFAPEGGAVPEITFADVPEDFWAYDEITWAYENGYVNGNTATTFNPDGTITRQQVWMILARLSGATPTDMTAAKAWAVANGVSDGTNPGAPVTRQQLAAMLYRYAVANGMAAVTLEENLSGFPDAASVSSYAVQALNWAVGRGIITGTTAGTLNPGGPATRAQFAVMLWRYCQTAAV